jgi:hypothetical protein
MHNSNGGFENNGWLSVDVSTLTVKQFATAGSKDMLPSGVYVGS